MRLHHTNGDGAELIIKKWIQNSNANSRAGEVDYQATNLLTN